MFNDTYNEILKKLIARLPVLYGRQLRAKNPTIFREILKNGNYDQNITTYDILEYIDSCTQKIKEYNFNFKVYWTLMKFTDFPRCRNGHIIYPKKSFRVRIDSDTLEVSSNLAKFCNDSKCIQSNPIVRQHSITSCRQKYGYDNVFQAPKIKQKIVETNRRKLGVDHPAQSKEVKQKTAKTCLRKFGVENPFQNEDIKRKSKETLLRKTGYDNPMKNPEIMRKIQSEEIARDGYTHITKRNKAPGFHKNILNNIYDEPMFSLEDFLRIDNHKVPLRFRCKKCKQEFESIHVRHHNRCPKCYPLDWIEVKPSYLSSLNRRFQSILDKNDISYVAEFKLNFNAQNDNRTYRRYDFKIGSHIIELNGDYWHARPKFIYRGKPIEADTELSFVGNRKIKAKDIWKYDEEKRILAESYGLTVAYLWESDMNAMTDDEILDWLTKLLQIHK